MDDNTPEQPKFDFPTRERAQQKRGAETNGFLMELPRTGGQAHVRHLSMADLTTVAGLPVRTQDTVLRVFRESAEDGGTGSVALSWAQLSKNQRRTRDMADAICCAGFITPRLVLTEAELNSDPHVMLVSDLHVTERIRYLNICVGQDEEAAKKLQPFPGAAPRLVPTLQALPSPEETLRGDSIQ